jgi:propanol-preferring alcohol dehydrogenase
MVLEKANTPLRLQEVPDSTPGPGQVLAKVAACDVCRTDLPIVDGELGDPKLPLIPGHETSVVSKPLAQMSPLSASVIVSAFPGLNAGHWPASSVE